MSKPHRFATCGLSFTRHQWDFLRQIPAEDNLALFTPKDQSLARSLAEIGAVHIDAGLAAKHARIQAGRSLLAYLAHRPHGRIDRSWTHLRFE